MADTAQQAYDAIVAHMDSQISRFGGGYSNWYCGIALDDEKRLFDEHRVSKDTGWYMSRECVDNESARAVEKALLKLSCSGGPGGGDKDSIYVYAYLKTAETNP